MRCNVISDYVTYIIVILVFIWITKYLYNRRTLYKLAYQLDGPFAWPIIGNALWFMGNTEDMFRSIFLLATQYRPLCRIWMANRLYVFITKPKDLEIILNSPKSLEKDSLYSILTPLLGNGLLNAPVPHWKRHRKIIMPTFNKKVLDTFMPIFVEQSNILVKQLEKHVNTGYFDILQPISLAMLDIVCEKKLPKRKAFLERLVELCEQGSTFTDEELREEVDTMMITSSDTSANVISFVCAMLGAHPAVQERVYEELVEVYGENNWHVTVQSLPKLQYLERVIKETMRLFPVAPILLRAITDELTIESCTLPRGRAHAKPADIRLAGELILRVVEGNLVEIEKRE